MKSKETRDFERIEDAIRLCEVEACGNCPLFGVGGSVECFNIVGYINHLKSTTQLKELLSALYQRTVKENGCFVVFRKDIVELAKDYEIKEEELK